ncbi:peroxiredoxin Q/BCP [Mariprofundus ferrinatatus]|uniref:thioredoxin-dependent peroxiredoxin n=1 Tax=Mariprofundus ferrinatatus TaxID=1921087 RepID=A0A2K8L3A9_9PROT|nr:peroxiredoxin [Mariprofundus ferrinatatus]ATX81818.1 peroxiredoxin Q/BCP [Mariprofundus ferrinatatus]
MTERYVPANHELAKKVQRAIAMAVAGMIAVVIVPAVVIIGVIVNNGKPIQVGKEVPEFILPNQNNANVSVKDYLGHWCLVYFYNEGRPEGLVQARRFRESYESFQQLDLQLIGISYDSVPSHREFAEKLNITHPLLSDPDGEVIEEYSAHSSMNHLARNLSYLIDGDGIVKKVYLDISPDEHVRALTEDIRQLTQL